jgi:hypothetical protein
MEVLHFRVLRRYVTNHVITSCPLFEDSDDFQLIR